MHKPSSQVNSSSRQAVNFKFRALSSPSIRLKKPEEEKEEEDSEKASVFPDSEQEEDSLIKYLNGDSFF